MIAPTLAWASVVWSCVAWACLEWANVECACLAWWGLALGLLAGSTVLAALPPRRGRMVPEPGRISVVIPLHRDDPGLAAATRSAADPAVAEVLLAGTDAAGTAIAGAAAALAGSAIPVRAIATQRAAAVNPEIVNPKIANLVAPVAAVRHDLILIKDALSLLTPGTPDAMRVALARPGTGLVAALPVARAPHGFAAWVEAALINTHGARMLLAADRFGQGFGVGAAMLMRRDDLARAGGIAGADAVADDAALARLFSGIGLATRLAGVAEQTLGRRTLPALFARHRRWALCRRLEAPFAFWGEPLLGLPAALLAGALAAPLWGGTPELVCVATAFAWIAAETTLAAIRGWPLGWPTPAAILAREALMPALWVAALATRRLRWGGAVLPVRRGRLSTSAP